MAVDAYNTMGVAVSTTGLLSVSSGALLRNEISIYFVAQKEISGSGPITCNDPRAIKLGEQLSTTGVAGADTGPVRIAAFWRTNNPGDPVAVTFNTAVGEVAWGSVALLRDVASPFGFWTVDAAWGVDATAGAAWSATLGSIELQANDLCVVGSVIPTDVSTPSQFSAEAIAATGMTFGAMVEKVEPDTTSGLDLGGFIFTQPVSAGALASVTPTVTATAGGTVTNVYGATILVRARYTPLDITTEDVAYFVLQPGAIDINELPQHQLDAAYIYENVGAAEVVGRIYVEGWSMGHDLRGPAYEFYYYPGSATYLYMHIT